MDIFLINHKDSKSQSREEVVFLTAKTQGHKVAKGLFFFTTKTQGHKVAKGLFF